jgi:hypothetical protein
MANHQHEDNKNKAKIAYSWQAKVHYFDFVAFA